MKNPNVQPSEERRNKLRFTAVLAAAGSLALSACGPGVDTEPKASATSSETTTSQPANTSETATPTNSIPSNTEVPVSTGEPPVDLEQRVEWVNNLDPEDLLLNRPDEIYNLASDQTKMKAVLDFLSKTDYDEKFNNSYATLVHDETDDIYFYDDDAEPDSELKQERAKHNLEKSNPANGIGLESSPQQIINEIIYTKYQALSAMENPNSTNRVMKPELGNRIINALYHFNKDWPAPLGDFTATKNIIDSQSDVQYWGNNALEVTKESELFDQVIDSEGNTVPARMMTVKPIDAYTLQRQQAGLASDSVILTGWFKIDNPKEGEPAGIWKIISIAAKEKNIDDPMKLNLKK